MRIIPELILLSICFVFAVDCEKQFAQKLCRTADDCDWDWCCIDAVTRIPGFKGICGTPTQRGEMCNPDPNDMKEGRYIEACPCDSGLNCRQSAESNNVKGKPIYVCQP